MDLDHDACYRAICQRDARFDGRFFTGVKTTGIYCRPVCPARTPLSKNVIFFPTAAAAQEAGYRPCLRCRPETAPDMGAWRGTSNTVSRALTLIEHGALDEDDVDGLAGRLGLGERQLRRLFRQHLGASPITVAQTRRILLAKQLIHETQLPMAEIAFASGFGSVRRFNEAFQTLFGRPPGELRRSSKSERGARTSRRNRPVASLSSTLRLVRHIGISAAARNRRRRICYRQPIRPISEAGWRARHSRGRTRRWQCAARDRPLSKAVSLAGDHRAAAARVRSGGRSARHCRASYARSDFVAFSQSAAGASRSRRVGRV